MIVDIGDFNFQFFNLPNYVKRELYKLYESEHRSEVNGSIDFTIDLETSSFIRRFFRRQKVFMLDGQRIFNPVAYDKCLPSVEWAMNWCIGSYDHSKILIHASVVEKNGKAIVFPASQGSGKSTLSAYLGLKSWNLFSDEFAVIDIASGFVSPLFRPASLKNNSIDIIRSAFPNAMYSCVTKGTQKGDVAHVKTMNRLHFNSLQPAKIAGVVTPKYRKNSEVEILSLNMTQALSILIRNSFNYSILGDIAFKKLCTIASDAEAYAITYSDFDDIESTLHKIIR
ncbi:MULTISPECIES: HprK-related kinase A [unclassified Alteromonas]|uniref:HprK-related kinase A n=1 Tax=unclassified Alteromonas TaxID=2614992 RepID=UPI001EF336F6|nr:MULTISPECIES: HprK-related kinase A [unclassified Alteromonas]MCG7638494.1 HprK-related kinase A [Alteromonas sp. CNT1-28]MCG7812592.1 HprK-related kinase A [Alteromonas sp. MCA-1]